LPLSLGMRLVLVTLQLAALLQYANTVSFPPTLTKMPPKEVAFNIGESIKLECEASGDPAPTFIWKRNEQEFDWTKNSGRYKKYPGAGTLVFISPGEDDDGIYQCLAKNDLGVAASVKTVLRRAELYNFAKEPDVNVERSSGDKVTFPCNAPTSYPEATIVWYRVTGAGTQTLTMSNRINIHPVTGALMFANVQESDTATYKCGVRNDIVRRTAEGRNYKLTVRTNVLYPAAQLMAQKPSVQSALVNKTLDLFCFFSGYPTPMIEWKKDSAKITTSEEWARMQLLDSGARLQLIDIDKDIHTGNYQCTGTNAQIGGSPPSGTFVVNVFSEPYWIEKPTDISVPEGGSHTFRCEAGSADGDPKWFINGVPANQYDNRSAPVGKEFHFKNLTLKDPLVVQCNCTNKYGYIYTNAYLNVLREPPTFVLAPADTKAAARSRFIMPCQTFSAPRAVVAWKKNGEPITGGRYQLQDNGDLLIAELSITDSGTYECTATNDFGSRTASGTVTVRQPTEISMAPQDTRVYEGQEVKLICTAITDLKEEKNLIIQWSKDGTIIDFDQNPRLTINLPDYSLIVSGAKPLDTGIYTCNATNGLDYDSKSAMLMIMGRPEMPTNLEVDCDKFKSDDIAQVKWNPGTDNYAPVLRYVVEFSTQYASDTWYVAPQFGSTEPTDTQVQVKMHPNIQYSFRVKGINVVGESEPSRSVTSPSCRLQPKIPSVNPTNLWAEGNRPQNLVVYWTPLSPLDYNGEKVSYVLIVECMNCVTMPKGSRNETQIVNPRQEKVEFNDLYVGNTRYNIEVFKKYRLSIYARNSEGDSSATRPESVGYSGEEAPTVSPDNFALDSGSGSDPLQSDSVLLSWSMQSDPEKDVDRIRGYFRGFRVEWCLSNLTAADCLVKKRFQDFIFRAIDGPSMVGTLNTRTKRQAVAAFTYNGKLTHLPGSTTIRAWVRVLNKYYAGPPSATVEFTTKEGTPGQVGDFVLSVTGVNHLEFDWQVPPQPNGRLIGYQMAYQEINGLSLGYLTLAPPLTDPTQTRGAVTGLKPDTNYRVYLYARTAVGNGEPNFLDVRTAPPNKAPSPPTFSVSAIGQQAFNVTFAPSTAGVSGSVFYVQYRMPGRNKWFETQREYRNRWIQIDGLENDAWYDIRVVATNGAAMTSYSDIVRMQTGGEPSPNALRGASATWFICMVLILLALIALIIFLFFVRKRRLEAKRGKLLPQEDEPQLGAGFGGPYASGFQSGAAAAAGGEGDFEPDEPPMENKPHTFMSSGDEPPPMSAAAASYAAAPASPPYNDDEYNPVNKPAFSAASPGQVQAPQLPPKPAPRVPGRRSIEGSIDSLPRRSSDPPEEDYQPEQHGFLRAYAPPPPPPSEPQPQSVPPPPPPKPKPKKAPKPASRQHQQEPPPPPDSYYRPPSQGSFGGPGGISGSTDV
ncbi:hypothetical protein BOX15_Mlig006634g9, partial [Macrostomum lignano]